LGRVKEELKRRSKVIGAFPNEEWITRNRYYLWKIKIIQWYKGR